MSMSMSMSMSIEHEVQPWPYIPHPGVSSRARYPEVALRQCPRDGPQRAFIPKFHYRPIEVRGG